MQLKIIILSEVSHKEKDKYHMISLKHGINMGQINHLQNRGRFTDIEIRFVVTKVGEGRGKMDWEFQVHGCKPLRIECMNKVLLYRPGKYIQYPGMETNRKRMYMYN